MTRKTYAFIAVALTLAAAGCQWQMSHQPRYKPLQESDFFGDGRSARPLEAGTVPHDQAPDEILDYGETPTPPEPRWAAAITGLGGNGFNAAALLGGGYAFPVRIDSDLLKRGRERYNIYCSVCHDRIGTGYGKVVERGYLRPPSYHIARLREAPPIHFYDVITRGQGAMPSYEEKIAPADRWAIIAYILALQLSQDAPYSSLTEAGREKIGSWKEQK